jgi:hypothetical protein
VRVASEAAAPRPAESSRARHRRRRDCVAARRRRSSPGRRDYYAVDDGLLFYEWNGEASEAMYVEKMFAPDSPQTFQEGLVNGVVSVNRTGAESAGYVVNVGAGRTARLRLCYGGFNYKFAVSVQGHNMTIIAKDGTYVRPVTVERIVMHAAERYDVLVTADQGVGDFSIDFEVRRRLGLGFRLGLVTPPSIHLHPRALCRSLRISIVARRMHFSRVAVADNQLVREGGEPPSLLFTTT